MTKDEILLIVIAVVSAIVIYLDIYIWRPL
jgi:hypothetical protein